MKRMISRAPRVNPPRWPVLVLLIAALGELQGVGAYDFSGCCGSKLKHWFDFSDSSVYGSSEVTKISGFTDKMSNAAGNTVNGNVKYKVNVQNGLNAIYTNEQYASVQFDSVSGVNPEVFIAYRIVNNVGGRPQPHGFIFGGRAGYAFGLNGVQITRIHNLATTW